MENEYYYYCCFVFTQVIVCDIYKCGFRSWLTAISIMEDVYTVEDYLNNNIDNKELKKTTQNALRLRSIENHTLRTTIWRESMKVKLNWTVVKIKKLIILLINDLIVDSIVCN